MEVDELSSVGVGLSRRRSGLLCCEEVVRGEKMNFVERMVVGVTMRFGLQKE